MAETEENRETFAAACVQFDVRAGDVESNRAAAEDGIGAAAAEGAELCVLPEMWSTSFVAEYTPDVVAAAAEAERMLQSLSAEHGIVIVGSAVEVDAGRTFNTARVWDEGRLVGTYRKIHLFSPNAEHKHFEAGEVPLLVDTHVGRLGVLVCYDLRFPELSRYYFHEGAEVLVVPAQWPEARAQHWRTLLRARAIENEVFVIGCNRTGQEPSLKTDDQLLFPGDSRIVDPTGEVIASASGADGPLTATIELRKVRTMRRILPVGRDQRPVVYRRLLESAWPDMLTQSRDGDGGDGT